LFAEGGSSKVKEKTIQSKEETRSALLKRGRLHERPEWVSDNRGISWEDKDKGREERVAAPGADTIAVAGEFSLVGCLTLGLDHEDIINAIKGQIYRLNQLWLEK
jgi:hypothetical protein